MSLTSPWLEIGSTINRVRAYGENPPAQAPNSVRIVIDARVDSRGRITLYWGVDDRTIGNPSIQVAYDGKAVGVDGVVGDSSVDLQFQVTHKNGVVSVIGPGTEP